MVTKYDRPVVVVMAAEEYERLKALDERGSVAAKPKGKKL
ncbi:MAG: hypothetical protein FJX02_16280 [Alphaproteobacteria bacterium]|jgi:PHD/YefM family antitoxin component YafN of YafNO toxin-antitoxin module|nr:hypothetical protein [Alphaproteobacteria bacterium]